jgi:DNA-binding LytR/AlgR family response regulator
VLYFQSDEKYTIVKTATAEHVIRTTLTELAAQLDADEFWQIHRSTIVNLNFIASTRRDDNARLFVRIKGTDAELPVSRAYVHLFKQM